MSLNHLMHPRNIYKDNTPDFKDLSIKYAYFRSFARENKNGDVTIDFKNPEALRALLYALLENDMDLKIDIPLDRLIPTLPLRLNYIHWVEDLVKCLERDRDATILGIDIGTGTSCIYPLLGTKLNGWKFLATEVDEYSVRHAQHNIQQNGFTDNITVQLVSQDSYLLQLLEDTNLKGATFCMCNPPFFASEDEAILGDSRTDKRSLPISVSTGSTKETVTRGGEVEFVKHIIEDSLKLQQNVSWYSTMLGKKTSMKAVVDCLKEKQVPTVTTTRFCQGKTMRWGVAWSFLTGITVDIGPPSKRRKKETKSLSFNISKDSPALRCDGIHSRFERALKLMDDILMDLKIAIDERELGDGVCRWQCSASEITWSNQRRKRREKKSGDNSKNSGLGNTYVASEVVICKSSEDEAKTEKGTINVEDDCESRELIQTSCCLSHGRNNDVDTQDTQLQASSNSLLFERDLRKEVIEALKTGPMTNNTQGTPSTPVCTFRVRLDTKDKLQEDNDLDVEVECIEAANKNHVYQFYQYLHNKLVRGL